MMKKKLLLLAFAFVFAFSFAITQTYQANADDEEVYYELLDSTATFDNSNANLTYDTSTKTGRINSPSLPIDTKYFSFATHDYYTTADGIKPFAQATAEYSVTFSNIGDLSEIVDTKRMGLLFKLGDYDAKLGVGALPNPSYSGYAYFALGKKEDIDSPFVTESQHGNSRPFKEAGFIEGDNVLKAVITPKIGDVDGSIVISLNGGTTYTFVYEGTELPQVGIMVAKNTADISNASLKIKDMTGWFYGYDLFGYDKAEHTLSADNKTPEDKVSYDFATKTGSIDCSWNTTSSDNHTTAYINIDAPDKVIDLNDEIVDYSTINTVTVSATYYNVQALDETLDGAFSNSSSNAERVGFRLRDVDTNEVGGFFINPVPTGAGTPVDYGVIERTSVSNTNFAPENTSSNIRFTRTDPWTDGAVTLALKITPATADTIGSIEISVDGAVATTITYHGENMPRVGLYARGVTVSIKDVSYVLANTVNVHEHSEQILEAVAKTCDTSGLTQGSKCSVCEMILVEQNEIPASHETVHVPAQPATCTEDGNIEYWACGECSKNFSDAECQLEVDDVVDYKTGHSGQHVEYAPATCASAGHNEHWWCEKCSTAFSEEECTNEIDDYVIPALDHSPQYVARQPATCTQTGITEHYACENCGKKFSDEECLDELDDVTLPISHNAEYVPAQPATCTQTGNIPHYACEDCGKKFSDAECLNELDDVTTPISHNAVRVAPQSATCTQTGNIEHYACEDCGKKFSDEDCLNELDDVTTPISHNAVRVAPQPANCTQTGNIEHYACENCGKKWTDESLSNEVSASDVTLPIAHDEGDWIIDSQPTTSSTGLKHTECNICGEVVKTESIPVVSGGGKGKGKGCNSSIDTVGVTLGAVVTLACLAILLWRKKKIDG